MAAAGLVGRLPATACRVRLIESDAIGTVGVGEATLPHVRTFIQSLGLDEAEFIAATEATIKLGIDFVGWGQPDSRYIHPFGAFGETIASAEFQHGWLRAHQAGRAGPFQSYSFAVEAARAGKFAPPQPPEARNIASAYDYAYHFDASLYARYLRSYAEARGLKRTEGEVAKVDLDPHTGNIASLILKSGEVVTGDLFIDCSGFRSVLAGEALKSGWQDWSAWLPCDRAWAVPSEKIPALPPYTQATARTAGWQWTIPLQHRTGDGYVFASNFISDDAAAAELMANLGGAAQAEPRLLRFSPGRRTQAWVKNCIAVGLASGFLEPLESTSLYLAQIAVTNLIDLWPTAQGDDRLRAAFNRRVDTEYDRVRDFLILHYYANQRSDGELWRYTREMVVPDSLIERIALFEETSTIAHSPGGLFSAQSWLAIYNGQGIAPRGYSRLVDSVLLDALAGRLDDLSQRIATGVEALPTHAAFLAGVS